MLFSVSLRDRGRLPERPWFHTLLLAANSLGMDASRSLKVCRVGMRVASFIRQGNRINLGFRCLRDRFFMPVLLLVVRVCFCLGHVHLLRRGLQ